MVGARRQLRWRRCCRRYWYTVGAFAGLALVSAVCCMARLLLAAAWHNTLVASIIVARPVSSNARFDGCLRGQWR